MAFSKDRSKWWGGFLDLTSDESRTAVDVLRQRYVEEMQQTDRFKQHARRMHYPQYQGKLLQLAAEKGKHAQ
jgi:hypothetical protein